MVDSWQLCYKFDVVSRVLSLQSCVWPVTNLHWQQQAWTTAELQMGFRVQCALLQSTNRMFSLGLPSDRPSLGYRPGTAGMCSASALTTYRASALTTYRASALTTYRASALTTYRKATAFFHTSRCSFMVHDATRTCYIPAPMFLKT